VNNPGAHESPAVSLSPSSLVHRPIIERLWQLYRHDLSEFWGTMPDAEGLFPPGRLPTSFNDPDWSGYLIHSGPSIAGFALIRGIAAEPRVIADFFVVRAARRQRVGHDAALDLLHRHPGRWEIPFQDVNTAAASFWRRVATDAVGATWTQEARPVPGKPGIPPDTWLMLAI